MRSERLARLVPLVLVALMGSLAACAGQSASYTRFRRAAENGRTIASHEVRVADFVNRFAQDDASAAVLDSPDATALYVDARLASPHLPREGATALLGVTLRGVPRTVRVPADLVIVIDVSGSMNDDGKISAVRHALARMLESLDPTDRIAIVTFSDGAHEALPLTSVGAARPVILEAIASLGAWGGTNLHDGLARGVDVVRRLRSDNARLVFLSDGMATVGETSPEAIRAAASPLGALHVPITTIGVGDAIDFELLEALARDHDGAFHFVDQPAEVERVFATYARSLSEVSARAVELRVQAPPGGRISRVFDERAIVDDAGRSVRVRVGDFGASDAYVGLYELEIPAGVAPSTVPLEIRFRTVDGIEEQRITQGAAFGYDGVGTYALVDGREPGLYRAATMGYAALGLREASLADERGDLATAEGWLRSTLFAVRAAQRQLALADPARAATLAEPLALLERSHAAVLARSPRREEGSADVVNAVHPQTVVLGPSPVVVSPGTLPVLTPQIITPGPTFAAVPTSPTVAGPVVAPVTGGVGPATSNTPASARFAGWR